MVAALLLLLAPVAHGDSPEDWVKLYDALLVASADGDLEQAVVDLRQLVQSELDGNDPARVEAVRWLGQTLYTLGRIDEAREVLQDGIRSGTCSPACRALHETIEIERASIDRVPTRWTFDDPSHGFFHPWALQTQGSIRLDQASNGNAALVWETIVQPRQSDLLVVGFADMSSPAEVVAFTATSQNLDAVVQLVVLDTYGREFVSLGFGLPKGTPRRVRVPLEDLVPVGGQPGTFDPAHAARLYLVDQTGPEKKSSGKNELWIDDFMVR